MGKTVWASDDRNASGQRKLTSGIDYDDHMRDRVADIVSSVERSLFTQLPPWCSFQGVTCRNISGSPGHVTMIDLHSRKLAGSLPTSIGNFEYLKSFDISLNSLTGSIPSTIKNWNISITHLDLRDNKFIGTIPSSYTSLQHLGHFDIASNLFTGTLSTSIGALTASTCTTTI